MKYYLVEFVTKVQGYKHWKINITADNLKEAKLIAQEMWKADGHKAHMFHLKARLLKDDEKFLYNEFKYEWILYY